MGSILITVAIDTAPFFSKAIEEQYLKIRNSQKFHAFLDYDGGENSLKNKIDSDFFEYSIEERKLEQDGYDFGAFKGTLFSNYFTPIYNIRKDKFKEWIDDEIESALNILNASNDLLGNLEKEIIRLREEGKGKEHKKQEDYEKELKNNIKLDKMAFLLIDISRSLWGEEEGKYVEYDGVTSYPITKIRASRISLKFSKAGIAYLFLEVKMSKEAPFNSYSKLVNEIIKNPNDLFQKKFEAYKNKVCGLDPNNPRCIYADITLDLMSVLANEKKEQVFNKRLWTLSIVSLFYFFEKTPDFKAQLEKIVGGECKDGDDVDLKDRFLNVRHRVKPFANLPPTRNYFIVYHLPSSMLADSVGPDPIFSKVPKREACKYSELNFALNSVYPGESLMQTKEQDESVLLGLDLSNLKNEHCFISSEVGIIVNDNKRIYFGGANIPYDDYWRCIIKGLGFLTGGKTLLQVVQSSLVGMNSGLRLVMDDEFNHKDEVKGSPRHFRFIIKPWRIIRGDRVKSFFNIKLLLELKRLLQENFYIADLRAKLRIALEPSSMSRAPFIRKKFENYMKVSGLKDLSKALNENSHEFNTTQIQLVRATLTVVKKVNCGNLAVYLTDTIKRIMHELLHTAYPRTTLPNGSLSQSRS